MQVETVSIIGLNRLTVSAALAIKQKLKSLTVLGFDPDPSGEVNNKVLKMEAVDKIAPSLKAAATTGDIILLGYPYEKTQELLVDIGPLLQPHAVVTDLGPLKRPVQDWADKFMTNGHYVCAMPLPSAASLQAGRLAYDVELADPELFKDSLMCIMPSPKVDQAAVETISGLGRVFGTDPYFIDMDEYDVYVQALETLPALLSAALFRGLSTQTGWGDMQKLAGFPFAHQTKLLDQTANNQLALLNAHKEGVGHWIDLMISQLTEMRDWINTVDKVTLDELLHNIGDDRDRWLFMREKNDWSAPSTQVNEGDMMQMLLGGFGQRLRRNNHEE